MGFAQDATTRDCPLSRGDILITSDHLGFDGIFVAPFEQGEIGPDLFRKACEFGLEGLVSKRADGPYRAGRSPDCDQGEEQQAPVDGAGDGDVRMTTLAKLLVLWRAGAIRRWSKCWTRSYDSPYKRRTHIKLGCGLLAHCR